MSDFVEKFKAVIDNNDVFTDKDSELEELCIDYLCERGFKVFDTNINFGLNKVDDLVNFFYKKSYKTFGRVIPITSNVYDRTAARNMINEQRSNFNISKKAAINECAYIIDILFDNYSLTGLKTPITFNAFMSNGLLWVREKLNNIIYNNEKLAVEYKVDLFYDSFKNNTEGPSVDELDKVLKNIKSKEVSNGKKK